MAIKSIAPFPDHSGGLEEGGTRIPSSSGGHASRRNGPGMLAVLALMLIAAAAMIPMSPMSDEYDASSSGTCGENLSWNLDRSGNLVISGSGPMDDYSINSPWADNRIKSVTIEDQVTSIGSYAFFGCSYLRTISMPDSIVSIGSYAFFGCSNLGSISIPGHVVSIGEQSFVGTPIKSLAIPDSADSIGDYAFSGCDSLESVSIGNSVGRIGDYAFYGCDSLESVSFGSSVARIGAWAFSDCVSLASVDIPCSAESIGDGAFCGCFSLESIAVDQENAKYSSSDGVLFDKDKTLLIAYPAGKQDYVYEIPSSVGSIGIRAFFRCNHLASVGIPDSVASIGSYAFFGCGSLVSAAIPSSVASIGDWAFSECGSLASLTIGDSAGPIGIGAFDNCVSLSYVAIGDSVGPIGAYAFYGLEFYAGTSLLDYGSLPGHTFAGSGDGKLYSSDSELSYSVRDGEAILNGFGAGYAGARDIIAIPSEYNGCPVTSIASKAFYGCADLKHVTIPASVKTIGSYAFYRCASLESVSLGLVESVGLKSFSYCQSLADISIPSTLKRIGSYAFYSCGLTSLTIPGDDVVLEASAFSACKNMKDIHFTGHGAVIGTNAFYKNNGVSSVDLSTVASVGFKAFPYCNGLTSLTIPSNISVVSEYAFFNCINLKDLTVEDGVRKIGKSAFSGCRSLENVSLPKSLIYLGPNAFYGIVFEDPDGNAMDYTLKLRGHTYVGSGRVLCMLEDLIDGEQFSADGLDYIIISADSRKASITGYSGAVSAIPPSVTYKGWEISVASIADKAFYGCDTLVSADLKSAESIGMKAFANCPSIQSIEFGGDLDSIGSYAFYGLSFYEGKSKLTASPEMLKGHAFSGAAPKLYLVS